MLNIQPRPFPKLRTLGVIAALLTSLSFAVPAQAGAKAPEIPAIPPAVVIDTQVTIGPPVGYVLYLPNDQELLAMDVTSGSIRAVLPAQPQPNHGATTTLSALTAGSVPVPAIGMVVFAALFAALVGMVFLRRTPPAGA